MGTLLSYSWPLTIMIVLGILLVRNPKAFETIACIVLIIRSSSRFGCVKPEGRAAMTNQPLT